MLSLIERPRLASVKFQKPDELTVQFTSPVHFEPFLSEGGINQLHHASILVSLQQGEQNFGNLEILSVKRLTGEVFAFRVLLPTPLHGGEVFSVHANGGFCFDAHLPHGPILPSVAKVFLESLLLFPLPEGFEASITGTFLSLPFPFLFQKLEMLFKHGGCAPTYMINRKLWKVWRPLLLQLPLAMILDLQQNSDFPWEVFQNILPNYPWKKLWFLPFFIFCSFVCQTTSLIQWIQEMVQGDHLGSEVCFDRLEVGVR